VRVSKTKTFDKWLRGLKNNRAKAAVLFRVLRIQEKNLLGDFKRVGTDLYELRIHMSPGYRVYFTQKGKEIILLIGGGTKRTQQSDIEKAKKLLKQINNDGNHNF